MASRSTTGGENRLSFAKIAAMSAPPNAESSLTSNENELQAAETASGSNTDESSAAEPGSNYSYPTEPENTSTDPSVDELGRAVRDIDITLKKDRNGSEPSLNGQDDNGMPNSFDDDHTHLSSSSTKMTNFDSKSLASVTTFAMDEKDSVRPDDSASVQAIDEEESLSGPASGAPNSVTGSEAGGRVLRDHFLHANALRARGIPPGPGSFFNGSSQRSDVANLPDGVANNFMLPATPGSLQDGPSLHGFPLEPDEKLLEAMKSPKDRLLILQLEEKIRCFIGDSDEQSLELPPSNAFGRLLAHKLGDYYHLTHFVDNNVTSVRLHRTPFCRLPTPLSAVHGANNNTPPPSVPAMKIMRRADGERPSTEGSVAASSSVPSKAASDVGDSGQDGDRTGSSTGDTPAKDRLTLTREEREAKYQEVRERIFRDFPESAKSDTASGDSNPNMSRSSSTTGRKKTNKQRTPHDDSFEARSQFNAYYPGMPYGNGPMPYNAGMNDGTYSSQVPYLVGPGVPPPTGGYMSHGQNGTMYPGQMSMNNMPQYPMTVSPQMASNGPWQGGSMPQQSPYSGYASMSQPPGMVSQQSSNKSSPGMSNYAIPNPAQYQQPPAWNAPPYPGNYQPSPHQRHPPPVPWPNYPPQSMAGNMSSYQYAQFPGQHLNPSLPNSTGAHAMPVGFSQSPFNPQTRSFVPGGGAPLARHPSKSAQHTMQPYNNLQTGAQAQWTGYGEVSNNRSIDPMPGVHSSRLPASGPRDSIAKWGTPSHLPPKPPPSAVPSEFDLKHRSGAPSVPAAYPNSGMPGAKNSPHVVSGGTNMSKLN